MLTKEEEKKRRDRIARQSGNQALNTNKPYTVVQEGTSKPKGKLKAQGDATPQADFRPSWSKGSGTLNRLTEKYRQNPFSLQGGPELPIDAKAREMMQGLGEGAKNRYAEMAQGANMMGQGVMGAGRDVAGQAKPFARDVSSGFKTMMGGFGDALESVVPGLTIGQPAQEMYQNSQRKDQAKQNPVVPNVAEKPADQTETPPNIVSRPPQTGASQAPPTAMQNQQSYQGKPGNRYLDMAYAGSDELQKYIQGMPEGDRPIDLIRGTDRSFYDPRSQQEYATMAEAAFGVNRPDVMEQYGIEAPMQSKERLALMEMMGQGQKPQEFTYQRMTDPATGQDYLIKLSKDGQVVENLGTGDDIKNRIDPREQAQFDAQVLPVLMKAADMGPEEYQKAYNSLPKTMQKIADMFMGS